MNINDLPPDLGRHLAGPAGSLIALMWMEGTWPRKIAMFAAGWVLSYYGSPHLAEWLGFNEGFSGFLLGLFGMAIVDKLFTAWKDLQVGQIFTDWLKKRLGVE